MSAPQRHDDRQRQGGNPAAEQGGGGDPVAEVLTVAAGGLAVLLVAPLLAAWVLGRTWAERPSAWRPVRWPARVAAVLAATLGLVAALRYWRAWVDLAWPVAWPDTVLAVGLWWAALAPLALIVARLRARGQGTALVEGRCEPTRADNVRGAVWEATLRDLSRRAGARPARRPRPEVRNPHAVPADVLGTAAVHDPRGVLVRLRARAAARSPEPAWHDGPRARGRLVLPLHPPRVAMFGGSGSGKTVAQHRLIVAALEAGWRVLWLDGKGHPDDARTVLAQAEGRGLTSRWLNLAAPGGGDAYDLWRGDGSAVARKAAALMPRSAQGGTEHFAAWEAYALAALSRQPWRSSSDLIARLRNPAKWVGDDDQARQALAALNTRSNGVKVIDVVAAQVTAALTPLAAYVDGGSRGWSLDDDSGWDLAVASLDAGAVAGAERVASALLLDLDAYRVARRPEYARPLLVVADELGAVLTDPRVAEVVPRLMEQVRSQGIGLVVAAQSPETLGDMGPRLLGAGLDLWVGRVDEPDALVMLIGTGKRAEQAHQGTEGGAMWTGQTAAREQDALLVDPSVLRNLPTWTWLVKEARCAPTWAVVPPVPPRSAAESSDNNC